MNGAAWDWSDCECNPADPVGHTASISILPIDNFAGDEKLKISVIFEELQDVGDNQNDDIGLTLSVILIDDLYVNTKKTRELPDSHAYDPNGFSGYPFYNDGVPWKYLDSGTAESVVLDGRNTIAAQPIFSSSIDNNVEIMSAENELSLTYVGDLQRDISQIHWCGRPDVLLTADVYTGTKTYTLHIWTIRESDDDVINYCANDPTLMPNCIDPIPSADHECILPGEDGTFDLYLSPNQPWLSFGQDIITNAGTVAMRVRAGGDLTCQSMVYSSSKPLEVAPTFNMMDLQTNTNAILNTGGIQMDFIDYGVIEGNFDLELDDNRASFREASRFFNQLNLDHNIVGEPVVLVFDDLKEEDIEGISSTLKGQALAGQRFLILDGNLMEESTLAHELGHAIWSLQHPDETTETNNPALDDIDSEVVDDPHNLMTSGTRGNKKVINSFLRRYVWNRMQREE